MGSPNNDPVMSATPRQQHADYALCDGIGQQAVRTPDNEGFYLPCPVCGHWLLPLFGGRMPEHVRLNGSAKPQENRAMTDAQVHVLAQALKQEAQYIAVEASSHDGEWESVVHDFLDALASLGWTLPIDGSGRGAPAASTPSEEGAE